MIKDRTNSTRDQLIMELAGIECELQRHVIPDTLENMIKQLTTDRRELMKQNDELKRLLERQ